MWRRVLARDRAGSAAGREMHRPDWPLNSGLVYLRLGDKRYGNSRDSASSIGGLKSLFRSQPRATDVSDRLVPLVDAHADRPRHDCFILRVRFFGDAAFVDARAPLHARGVWLVPHLRGLSLGVFRNGGRAAR